MKRLVIENVDLMSVDEENELLDFLTDKKIGARMEKCEVVWEDDDE
jgi:hypothetical protein